MAKNPHQSPQRKIGLFVLRYQGLIAMAFSLMLMALFLFLWSRERPTKIERIVEHQADQGLQTASFMLPKDITFCGEEVPIEDEEVYRRIDRELHVVVFYHSRALMIFKRANLWYPIFEKIMKEEGVPTDFKYLVPVESSFENVRSYRGAGGFWQFMPMTAREYGLRVDREVDERNNPIKSCRAACKYIKDVKPYVGSWTNAMAAYNMGHAALRQQMRRQGEKDYFDLMLNRETTRYVPQVIAFKILMENPKRYGYALPKPTLYSASPTHTLRIDHSLENLKEFAQAMGINYKTLKYHNPWLLRNSLTVRKGEEYFIRVPKKIKVDGETVHIRIPPALRSNGPLGI